MQVKIRTVGFVQAVSAVQAIGAAGKQVGGTLATFGSPLPYARPIERNEFLSGPRRGQIARRAGPARMFELGIRALMRQAPGILAQAVVRGPHAIGAAKRKIRDIGVREIQARTPVLHDKLRPSVRALERPR